MQYKLHKHIYYIINAVKCHAKNGCFFEKKSSIYAGLGQGAIYSTLHRKEVVDDKKQDKKRVERPKGYF